MRISKKIFIISSSLLGILLFFWAIYFFSFQKSSEVLDAFQSDDTTPSNPQAPAARSKVLAVSEDAVRAVVLDKENSVIKYYAKDSGKAYQVDLDGNNKQVLSNKELPALSEVIWSPNRSKVISKLSQGGSAKFYYYNYKENKGVALKENLDTVVWQNDNKIIYKYYDPKSKERTLNIADPDGSHWKTIASLDQKYITTAPIPESSLISFWNKPDAFSESILQSVPALGGETKTILKGKFGGDYLWNNKGTYALLSHSNEKGGSKIQLGLLQYGNGEYKSLEIPTFVSKCAWSKDDAFIYYSLPGSIPENTVLPDKYDANTFTTIDTFWKVNITTGEKTRLVDLDKIKTPFDASNLFLSPDESELFFVNKIDSKLYKIAL